MRVKKVKLSNALPDLTTLFGENNTGKNLYIPLIFSEESQTHSVLQLFCSMVVRVTRQTLPCQEMITTLVNGRYNRRLVNLPLSLPKLVTGYNSRIDLRQE